MRYCVWTGSLWRTFSAVYLAEIYAEDLAETTEETVCVQTVRGKKTVSRIHPKKVFYPNSEKILSDKSEKRKFVQLLDNKVHTISN